MNNELRIMRDTNRIDYTRFILHNSYFILHTPILHYLIKKSTPLFYWITVGVGILGKRRRKIKNKATRLKNEDSKNGAKCLY